MAMTMFLRLLGLHLPPLRKRRFRSLSAVPIQVLLARLNLLQLLLKLMQFILKVMQLLLLKLLLQELRRLLAVLLWLVPLHPRLSLLLLLFASSRGHLARNHAKRLFGTTVRTAYLLHVVRSTDLAVLRIR